MAPESRPAAPSCLGAVHMCFSVVVAIGVLGMCCWWGASWIVSWVSHSTAASPFGPHLSEYLAAPQPMVAAEPPKDPEDVNVAERGVPNAIPPIKGKMIVVDQDAKGVDLDVHFALPDDLRASAPEEVGSVVLTSYKTTEVLDYYNDGSSGYRQACDVTVIDHASRTVIAKKKIWGGNPPETSHDIPWDRVGSKPTTSIVDYLKGLPRQ